MHREELSVRVVIFYSAQLQVRVYTLDQGIRAAAALYPGAACLRKRAVVFLYPGPPHTLDLHALDPAGIPWTRA